MQFQVPQYIEVEDKIVGSLSLKQFVYVAGAAGISYILFRKLPLFIGIPLIVVVAGFALLLAFYPKEKFGKPFVEILQSGIKFFLHTRLYTWKRVPKKPLPGEMRENKPSTTLSMPIPAVTEGKLKDLSWNIDVAGDKTENEEKDKTGKRNA